MSLIKILGLQSKPPAKVSQLLLILTCSAITIQCLYSHLQAKYDGKKTNKFSGMTKRLPDAVIAGVKKSGTSTFRYFLRFHSKVVCPLKEIHFFDNKFNEGYDWYVKQLPYSNKDQVVMEKTPKYFITPRAVDELSKINASVIILLRDPLVRVLSEHANNMAKYTKRNISINLTLEEEIFDDNGQINPKAVSINPSLYAQHLEHWLSHFQVGKNLLILDADNFQHKPWEELEKAQDFLGISREITKANFVFSRTKKFYCIRPPNTKAGRMCMDENKGRPHGRQNVSTLKALAGFFRPHNKRLFEMLGRKFHWVMYVKNTGLFEREEMTPI